MWKHQMIFDCILIHTWPKRYLATNCCCLENVRVSTPNLLWTYCISPYSFDILLMPFFIRYARMINILVASHAINSISKILENKNTSATKPYWKHFGFFPRFVVIIVFPLVKKKNSFLCMLSDCIVTYGRNNNNIILVARMENNFFCTLFSRTAGKLFICSNALVAFLRALESVSRSNSLIFVWLVSIHEC